MNVPAALASAPFATSRFPDDSRDTIAGPLGFHRVEILQAAPHDDGPTDDHPADAQRLGGLLVTLTPVPRWDVPEIIDGPQPVPVSTEYFSGRIERRWKPGSTRHCRLCGTCILTNCSTSRVECLVDVPDEVAELLDAMDDEEAERTAAGYSQEEGGRLDTV
jgi:hypothetical protein